MLIMSSSVLLKYYVCILLSLLSILKVDSQVRFPSSNDDDRPGISSDCNCIPIRRCPALRNRNDWRNAGVTCGPGNRENRRVCCPTSSWFPGETTRRRPRPLTPEPPVEPDPRNGPRPESGVCGISNYKEPLKPLIMGGENATEGQWPWMVAIRKRGSTGYYAPDCTGFLIDKRHVMSAAHCFPQRDADLYRARIGSINQNAADEYSVTQIVVHPGYKNGQFYDDIAIMTLDREVNFPNFNPVCLPNEQVSRIKLDNRGTTVAGWGADRNGGPMKAYLQFLARLEVMPNGECQRRLRNQLRDSFQRQFPNGVNRGFICAAFKGGNKDACGGDSGGPQMIQSRNRWYAVGIVSFGYKCGVPGMPGGYTRVANYLNWIRQNI